MKLAVYYMLVVALAMQSQLWERLCTIYYAIFYVL